MSLPNTVYKNYSIRYLLYIVFYDYEIHCCVYYVLDTLQFLAISILHNQDVETYNDNLDLSERM